MQEKDLLRTAAVLAAGFAVASSGSATGAQGLSGSDLFQSGLVVRGAEIPLPVVHVLPLEVLQKELVFWIQTARILMSPGLTPPLGGIPRVVLLVIVLDAVRLLVGGPCRTRRQDFLVQFK